MSQQELLLFDHQKQSPGGPPNPVKHQPPTRRVLDSAEVSPRDVDQVLQAIGGGQGKVDRLIATILACRGFVGTDTLAIVYPHEASLPDPGQMKNFEHAATLVHDAIRSGAKIGINGDYDVDGTTAVAQVINLLRRVKAPHEWTIPNRATDGYGLSEQIVERFIKAKCKLVLLFDHGSHNIKEIATLRRAGISVVVFDHHVVGPTLPDAVVVNPAQPGCGFSSYKPCASGLAFFLTHRLSEMLELPSPDCGLAALGTIADMVPLVGPNRTLARLGLTALQRGASRGVMHLAVRLGLVPSEVGSLDVGFYIGPAINAVGRLGDAAKCVRLLTSNDEGELQKLADELTTTNETRKQIQRGQVIANYDRLAGLKAMPGVLVSSHPEHHQGVVGLIAQSLAQRYGRPAFVFAEAEDGTLKGSARAGAEIYNLARMLDDVRRADQKGIIVKAGGHKAAAGITIKGDSIKEFAKLINEASRQQVPTPPTEVHVVADTVLTFNDLTQSLVKSLGEKLDPFGQGFLPPRFLFESVTVESIDEYDGGRRLVVLKQGSKKVRGFIGPECWDGSLLQGVVCDVVATAAVIYRKDKYHVQLSIEGYQVTQAQLKRQDEPASKVNHVIEKAPELQLPRITQPVSDSRVPSSTPAEYIALRREVVEAMRALPRRFLYADLEGLRPDPLGPKIQPRLEELRKKLIESNQLSALKAQSFTVRAEQVEFIRWFFGRTDNAILQAPTGTGKTEMALVIASKQRAQGHRTIFCAPTIEIARQVAERAPQMIDVTATLLDGEVSPKKRIEIYRQEPAFISAVPHVIKNDIERQAFTFRRTDLLVIDEGHHTTGDYPYVPLVKKAREAGARVLLLSATPGQVESDDKWHKFRALKALIGVRHIFPINVVRPHPKISPKHLEVTDVLRESLALLSQRLQSLRSYSIEKLIECGEPALAVEAGRLFGTSTLAFPSATAVLPFVGKVRVSSAEKERWKAVHALCAALELSELYQLLAYQGISGFLLRVVEKRFEIHFPIKAAQSSSGQVFLAPKKALSWVYGSSEVERVYHRLAKGSFLGLWRVGSLESISGLSIKDWGERSSKERRSEFNHRVPEALKRLSDELVKLPYSDHPKEEYLVQQILNQPSREQSIVFVRDRSHALFLAERLTHRMVDAGKRAVALTGSGQGAKRGLTREERKHNLEALGAGRAHVIVSTSAGNEGIDFARLQRGFAYRFSASPTDALQQWGRIGRRDAQGEIEYLCSTPEEHGKFSSILRRVADFYLMLNQERWEILGGRPLQLGDGSAFTLQSDA